MIRLLVLTLGMVVGLRLVAGPAVCHAQSEEAEELAKVKSAFVLNFARYTTWPPTAFADEESPLVITVVGRTRMLPYLSAIVREERVNGRSITVRWASYPQRDPQSTEGQAEREQFFAALRRSHLVFVAASERGHAGEVIEQLRGADVLAVSDATGFVDAGGMLELRYQHDRVVFDANADALAASGVELSSKVLRLARRVKRSAQS